MCAKPVPDPPYRDYTFARTEYSQGSLYVSHIIAALLLRYDVGHNRDEKRTQYTSGQHGITSTNSVFQFASAPKDRYVAVVPGGLHEMQMLGISADLIKPFDELPMFTSHVPSGEDHGEDTCEYTESILVKCPALSFPRMETVATRM